MPRSGSRRAAGPGPTTNSPPTCRTAAAGEPDLGSEVLRVGGEFSEALGGGAEQGPLHPPWCLEGQRPEGVR